MLLKCSLINTHYYRYTDLYIIILRAQFIIRILCQSLDLVYLICVFVIYFSFSASFSLVLIIQRH